MGSYSKVKAHLLRIPGHEVECCKAVAGDLVQQIKREHDQVEIKRFQDEFNEREKAEYINLPSSSDFLQHKKRKGAVVGSLEKSLNTARHDIAYKEAARMFYAGALPFNFVKSPYFRQYSKTLANSNLAGYTPPMYNRLRTTLLTQDKEHINRKLQPIRDSWKKKGVSIVSDGWSDRQRRLLINMMAASSGGAMFLKSIDASNNIKDGDYVASLFLQVINQIGDANIVQIITDNASNFKFAGLHIKSKYPHIFWTPCVVHSLNLALKNICDPSERSHQYTHCKWIADLVSDVQIIRNFIINHSMALSIYNKYSKLSLLRIADTRFASSIVMSKRLKKVKTALENMIMDSEWKSYRDANVESEAQKVKQCIVND
ncbi:uncharacterized protein LOC107415835 [Ziziphus jujuba]|nr:uncharacterized protein LOC107415835 [Ziziphus jujuba]